MSCILDNDQTKIPTFRSDLLWEQQLTFNSCSAFAPTQLRTNYDCISEQCSTTTHRGHHCGLQLSKHSVNRLSVSVNYTGRGKVRLARGNSLAVYLVSTSLAIRRFHQTLLLKSEQDLHALDALSTVLLASQLYQLSKPRHLVWLNVHLDQPQLSVVDPPPNQARVVRNQDFT
ncbi:hypothetical protein BD289DRAFT_430119 [Coniella lustricola]|uniref:Uncharacterized protein n=1 Tax=Coniella lustricola TaxID=2025994 RepID=A0A2T3ACC5_9PEZI|nr:hypothetical protein BD289DRAFT_430119 [Coniella lustricola]